MNPDNPYAAPQTIEPQLATVLPVAELAARNLYPELSTASLRRLASHSQAIDNMSMVWGVAAAFSGIAFYQQLGWYWFIIALVAGTRTWTGNQRTPGFWKINLILDVIVFVISLGIIAFVSLRMLFFTVEIPTLLILGTPLLLVTIFSGFSVVAHRAAEVLYGNYPHQSLIDEVAYRKRHGIQ